MTGDTNPQTSFCGMCRLLQYGQRHFRRSQQHLANERANMPWLRLGQIYVRTEVDTVLWGGKSEIIDRIIAVSAPGVMSGWCARRGAGERSPIRLAARRETGDEDRDLETWSGHRRVVVMSMICFWSRSTGCWGCKVDDHYANSCLIETINFNCYYHYLLCDYCLSVGPLPGQCPMGSLIITGWLRIKIPINRYNWLISFLSFISF